MRRPRPLSLAARLGWLFAALMALAFSASGWHLLDSLSQQLRRRDDMILMDTVAILRHQLREFEGVEAVRADPHRLLDVILGQNGMSLLLRDASGVLLAASPTDTRSLAEHSFVPAGEDTSAVHDWHGAAGKRGRMIAAWSRVGDPPGDRVLLVVAREEWERAALLTDFAVDLFWTVSTAVSAISLLAFFVLRRGLRPLRAMARTAGEITANRLHARLRIEDVPPELEEMVGAFNDMLDRLEESFRRLSQFSADIAHDLRTPIGNLMVEIQVALSKRRSVEEYEELLASNVEECERLARMVENMLFLARADNAQVALHPQRVCGAAELKRIAEYFEGLAEDAGITVDVDARGALTADVELFRRAVSNLLANAIRHTASGGRITVRGHSPEKGGYAIEISNPGPGIPAEILPRIFDRFFRVDASRGGSQSSSGLGLAIVRSIMTLHGGRVEVESVPNERTSFRLIFGTGDVDRTLRSR